MAYPSFYTVQFILVKITFAISIFNKSVLS